MPICTCRRFIYRPIIGQPRCDDDQRWTPSSKVVAFQLGAAFKPSKLGAERTKKLEFYSKLLSRLGYRYLVMDSEKENTDLTTGEFERILETCKMLGYPEPVMTIPMRRSDGWVRVKEITELVNAHRFGGICLVAGNPAYLSQDEIRNNSSKLMREAGEYYRSICRFNLLMVGTENVVKTAAYLAEKFKAMPVMLLTPQMNHELSFYGNNGLSKAVYAPFYFGTEPNHTIAEAIQAYVERRNAKTKTLNSHEAYILMGGHENFAAKMDLLAKAGVDVFIGFALDEKPVQFSSLSSAASLPRVQL